MRTLFRVVFAAQLLLFVLSALPSRAATSSATIPLDSPVYPWIERLDAAGYTPSAFAGLRPLTRNEALRLVREAERELAADDSPAVVMVETLARLQHEFAADLQATAGEGWLRPARTLRAEGRWRNGTTSTLQGMNYRQFALTPNDFGEELVDGATARFLVDGDAGIGWCMAEWTPRLSFDEDEVELALRAGRLAVALGPAELSVGRQSLWWGPGRHGSLLLSNNARGLDMVRLASPEPIPLPWIFSFFGPLRFDLFYSRLEENRVVARPSLFGMRLNLKPLPWLEIGAARTMIFGGKGRPHVGVGEFLEIVGGKNQNDGDTSNQIGAADLRLLIPLLGGMSLYGEVGGEDEANHQPAGAAWLAGVHLPRIDPAGRFSLRAEYADLSFQKGSAAIWYRHSVYRSGYTYYGRILGHHAGGGSRDLYLELGYVPMTDLFLTLSLDREVRGYERPVQERHLMPQLECAWTPSGSEWSVIAGVAVDFVENQGFVAGEDKRSWLTSVDLRREF